MTTAGDVLTAALERFEDGDAWCKGVTRMPRKDKTDRVCLIAGLSAGANVTRGSYYEAAPLVRGVIAERFPDRFLDGAYNLAVFNDHKKTAWPDVREVLVEARNRA